MRLIGTNMSLPLIPARYNAENLRRVLNDPSLLLREPENIKRNLTYYPNRTIGRWLFRREYGKEVDVMEQDWDNLIILDACRYDVFSEVNTPDGDLQRIVSKGSHSRDFIDTTFKSQTLNDTVYVSGNVKAADLGEDVFHRMVLTYSDEYSTGKYTSFKERYQRYYPEVVHDLTVENYEQYDQKRFIVHFMQPHAPYLGPEAERLREQFTDQYGLRFKAWERREEYDEDATYTESLLSAVEAGYGEPEDVWKVYVENLRVVLEYVEDLLERMDGKTVITADHGELFGDPTDHLYFGREFAHTKEVYVPELRLVPWLEIDANERRTITPGDPVGKDTVDKQMHDEQLEALGYK